VFKIILVDSRAICQINVIHSLTLKIRWFHRCDSRWRWIINVAAGRCIMLISRKPSHTPKWCVEWRITKLDKRFARHWTHGHAPSRIRGRNIYYRLAFNNWLIGWLRDRSNDNAALFRVINLHYWVSGEMRLTLCMFQRYNVDSMGVKYDYFSSMY